MYPATFNKSLKRLLDAGLVVQISKHRGQHPSVYERADSLDAASSLPQNRQSEGK